MTCDGCGMPIGAVIRLGEQAAALCPVCSLLEQRAKQTIEAQRPFRPRGEPDPRLTARVVSPEPVTDEGTPSDEFIREPTPGSTSIFDDR